MTKYKAVVSHTKNRHRTLNDDLEKLKMPGVTRVTKVTRKIRTKKKSSTTMLN